jgi:oxygen-dependent protoporphyrinogen oxidase
VNDVVVIGAGISGLAAAWELRQRGRQPLILEQSSRAGGVIVTERAHGFVIDGGPDALLVQKPAGVELCRELGLAQHLFPTNPPRTAFVLRHGQLTPLPEGSFLGIPSRIDSLIKSPLFSPAAKLRMATEILRPRQPLPDESIGQFIRRRFGQEAVDYLAEPLLAGIHAGDVERLSIHSLFPRLVSLEQTYGSVLRGVSAARSSAPPAANGAFVSLPHGLAELPETLAAALGHDTIRYQTRVVQISGASPYKLTLDSDASIYARHVIVTTPAWAASRMFSSLDPTLARLCAEIPYASSATVVFGLRRDRIDHPLDGSGFVVPRRERKSVMAATFITSKWPQRAPEGQASLRAFLGGATDPGALDRGDDALARTALDELRDLLRITGEPRLTRVFRWPRATPATANVCAGSRSAFPPCRGCSSLAVDTAERAFRIA